MTAIARLAPAVLVVLALTPSGCEDPLLTANTDPGSSAPSGTRVDDDLSDRVTCTCNGDRLLCTNVYGTAVSDCSKVIPNGHCAQQGPDGTATCLCPPHQLWCDTPWLLKSCDSVGRLADIVFCINFCDPTTLRCYGDPPPGNPG
jgi:hypothetical protein